MVKQPLSWNVLTAFRLGRQLTLYTRVSQWRRCVLTAFRLGRQLTPKNSRQINLPMVLTAFRLGRQLTLLSSTLILQQTCLNSLSARSSADWAYPC